jgi:hypothetical protein
MAAARFPRIGDEMKDAALFGGQCTVEEAIRIDSESNAKTTHIPSRLNPGKRTMRRYSAGVDSTSIQLSTGAGA